MNPFDLVDERAAMAEAGYRRGLAKHTDDLRLEASPASRSV
jgi:hypothetical protein